MLTRALVSLARETLGPLALSCAPSEAGEAGSQNWSSCSLLRHPGPLVSGLWSPWKAKEGFALLERTVSKPPAFQAKGVGPVGPSQESDTRETGAFLSLTPTDGMDKKDDIVVERRNAWH